jgi:deoxycytidylate deaminase
MTRLFETLFTLAQDHDDGVKTSVVAAIVNRKTIVSFGFNQRKTHPLQAKYAKNEHAIFLHAEIDAIRKAMKRGVDLSKCDLYIMRAKHTGPKRRDPVACAMARPCAGCQRAIADMGLRTIYYSTENSKRFARYTPNPL